MSLNIRRVAHRFGYQRVLDDIDLSIVPGEAVALVGPSGCGKTTLLNLAAGLLSPWEGCVDCSFQRPAMMFQQPRLLPWKRTRDNIALGLKATGQPRDIRHAKWKAGVTGFRRLQGSRDERVLHGAQTDVPWEVRAWRRTLLAAPR